MLIWLLFIYIAGLAIGIRRYHDRNKSAWWLLLSLIPLVGGLWMFIELGFLKGTEGPNGYGNTTVELEGRTYKLM